MLSQLFMLLYKVASTGMSFCILLLVVITRLSLHMTVCALYMCLNLLKFKENI